MELFEEIKIYEQEFSLKIQNSVEKFERAINKNKEHFNPLEGHLFQLKTHIIEFVNARMKNSLTISKNFLLPLKLQN